MSILKSPISGHMRLNMLWLVNGKMMMGYRLSYLINEIRLFVKTGGKFILIVTRFHCLQPAFHHIIFNSSYL